MLVATMGTDKHSLS